MLEGEEPAQELMLSGQLLQQLTVLRGRNVAEFVLAFLIVEVADDDQLAGHVLAGKSSQRAARAPARCVRAPCRSGRQVSSLAHANKPSNSEVPEPVPEPAALLTLFPHQELLAHAQVGGYRGRRDSPAADAEVDVLADPHGVTGTCTPRPYLAKASRRTHSSRHTRSTPTARDRWARLQRTPREPLIPPRHAEISGATDCLFWAPPLLSTEPTPAVHIGSVRALMS